MSGQMEIPDENRVLTYNTYRFGHEPSGHLNFIIDRSIYQTETVLNNGSWYSGIPPVNRWIPRFKHCPIAPHLTKYNKEPRV